MRKIVVPGEQVALAEWLDEDKQWLEERGDGAYDVERDDQPMPYKLPMERLAVIAAVTLPITAIASVYGMNMIVNSSTHWTELVVVLVVIALMTLLRRLVRDIDEGV